MQKTKNYQLNQWDASDPIRREDFNADNAALDAALAKKAEQAALNALQDSLTSANSTVAALSAALGSGGKNCRTVYGSYTGTGTYGPDNPTSLTFPFKPIWVMIMRSLKEDGATVPAKTYTSFLLRPLRAASSTNGNALYVTWTDSGVSWYCSAETTNPHLAQNNSSGFTYYWVALGVDG